MPAYTEDVDAFARAKAGLEAAKQILTTATHMHDAALKRLKDAIRESACAQVPDFKKRGYELTLEGVEVLPDCINVTLGRFVKGDLHPHDYVQVSLKR